MNEQEVWVRVFCASIGVNELSIPCTASAADVADEGLREFRKRARSVGPCLTQVIEIPGEHDHR